MRTGHHPSRQARALSILATLAILLTLTVGVVPGTAYAAQTITIAPTQPVYLVNNGDTAYVGYRMTYAGTPTTGLEQDITLTIATGGLLQVGAAPGGLTGVNTTLAGGSSTIAGGNTTLAQGSGTLSAASAIGATNVRVSSVTNFFVGQAINIDTGANLETRTIVTVGTTGSGGTGITVTPALDKAHSSGAVYAAATAAGSTNIRVASIANFAAGQTINVDTGANLESVTVAAVGAGGNATTLSAASAIGATNIKVGSVSGLAAGATLWVGAGADQESAVIASVGTTGATGSGVTFTAGLAKAHATGAPATNNILALTAGLAKAHAAATSGATIAVATLTLAGASNIKVVNANGFVVGQTINIDTGANLETATIASVGTSGAAGTGLDLTAALTLPHVGAPAVVQTDPSALAGATNVKVNSVMGYYVGDSMTIDTGANVETRTIAAVGTPGLGGTGIDLTAALAISHAAGATATETRVLPSTAVLGADYTVPSYTVVVPAGSGSGTVVTLPIVTLPNANPSVALTINTSAACTVGCAGVTVNNNDPSTVVINAHGFPYLDKSLPVAARVADLMSRMSLLDKVGQMDQTLLTVVNNGTTTNSSSYNNLRAWRLGSILSGGDTNPTPNSPTGWADMVDSLQYRTMAAPLQIPLIYGEDTIHGNAHMVGAVMFPHDIGMGATHNADLSYQQGVITAQETRSSGPQWGFGPTICAARDIRWGRTYECFSEDPALVNLMEPIIDGYQGSNPLDKSGMHMLASAKHFAGDGATQNGTNTGVDVMSSAEFERVALSPYIPAVQKYHTGTIMPSYSSTQLDGATTSIKMSANADLMTGWLKNTIGFDGFLISDYNAIDQIPVPSPNPLPSPINQSYAYQTMISFNAGMDMVMAPGNPAFKNFINYLVTLVNMGYVPQSRIDDAVNRILVQKFELGMFEQPFTDRSTQNQIYSAEHRAVARQAAAESQVLLKNANNILPLSKTAKIYLAGSNADSIINQAGGWSISWQSIPTNNVADVAPFFTTMRQALQNVVGTGNVTYSTTASPAPAAGAYDVGVVVVGETAYAEGSGDVPGSKTDAPTTADATAINNVCGVMPCIILSMAGRPFMLTDAQFNQAQAVVATWLPGSEGQGVADVLFGDLSFTGRLPMTWPRTMAQEPINVGDATYDPRYPFGWGLRTGSTRGRIEQTRDSLAGSGGDAHVQAAVGFLNTLLAADVWNLNGSVRVPGQTLQLLAKAAGELAGTDAETFVQTDGVVAAALEVAQAAVLRAGGPAAATSALIANADHEMLIGHPGVAVALLAKATGIALAPEVSNNLAAQTVQYSDYVQPVTIVANDGAGEPGLSASTQWSLDGGAFQDGLPSWLTLTPAPCTGDAIWSACSWTLAGTGAMSLNSGSYVVRTTVSDGKDTSTTTVSIVAKPEDARASYAGQQYVSTSGVNSSSASVNLVAGIQDITAVTGDVAYDANPGDIRTATVTFVNRDAGNAVLCSAGAIQLVSPADAKTGTASCSWTASISSADSVTYRVGVVVAGNYTGQADDTLVTVSKPLPGSIGGGGNLVNQASAGSKAGGAGLKTNFGFNVKTTKSGANFQGNVNVIVRSGGRIYQIKSNAISSLVTKVGTPTTPGTASFSGKAGITDITNPAAPVAVDGNASLQVGLTDRGEPGANDSIAITLWDKSGKLWFSSNWSGAKTVEQTLGGGNLAIR